MAKAIADQLGLRRLELGERAAADLDVQPCGLEIGLVDAVDECCRILDEVEDLGADLTGAKSRRCRRRRRGERRRSSADRRRLAGRSGRVAPRPARTGLSRVTSGNSPTSAKTACIASATAGSSMPASASNTIEPEMKLPAAPKLSARMVNPSADSESGLSNELSDDAPIVTDGHERRDEHRDPGGEYRAAVAEGEAAEAGPDRRPVGPPTSSGVGGAVGAGRSKVDMLFMTEHHVHFGVECNDLVTCLRTHEPGRHHDAHDHRPLRHTTPVSSGHARPSSRRECRSCSTRAPRR